MRLLLTGLAVALLLVGCGSSPGDAKAAPSAGVPGGGVATVRADLAGSGNPWLTLADHEIDDRSRSVCEGLPRFGTKFYVDLADRAETTSPRPDEVVPDMDRAQSLAVVKASVHAFCPDRADMLTW